MQSLPLESAQNAANSEEQLRVAVAKLYPDLPPSAQEQVREFWEDYCELLLEMFERCERQRGGDFDGPNAATYDEGKVDSSNKP